MVVKKLFGTVSEKVAILGFSFKANTNDTRESAAIQICRDLLAEGAELLIHDPKVIEKQIELDLGEQAINNHKNINESDSKFIKSGWENAIKLISALKMLMQF